MLAYGLPKERPWFLEAQCAYGYPGGIVNRYALHFPTRSKSDPMAHFVLEQWLRMRHDDVRRILRDAMQSLVDSNKLPRTEYRLILSNTRIPGFRVEEELPTVRLTPP